jgi:hypothetical protein
LLIEISKKTPLLLIKKSLLLIAEFELEKSLLIVQGDCYAVRSGTEIAYWHFVSSYLDEITGGRGTVFATGTPISNSTVNKNVCEVVSEILTL